MELLTLTALAGLLVALVSILPSVSPTSPEPVLLVLGLGLFATEMANCSHDCDSDEDSPSGSHGPYTLLKSQDMLSVMMQHDNNVWYCQFFRYGACMLQHALLSMFTNIIFTRCNPWSFAVVCNCQGDTAVEATNRKRKEIN
jgi:hypothetical protein